MPTNYEEMADVTDARMRESSGSDGWRALMARRFSGKPEELSGFLERLQRKFRELRYARMSDAKKILTCDFMDGEALNWVNLTWESQQGECVAYNLFIEELKEVFGDQRFKRQAREDISRIEQGSGSCLEYHRRFQELVVRAGYDMAQPPLFSLFMRGLAPRIKRHLDGYAELPETPAGLAALCCKLDNAQGPARVADVGSLAAKSSAGTPMQIDAVGRAGPKRAQGTSRPKVCFGCGQTGHIQYVCPNKTKSACDIVGAVQGGAFPVFIEQVLVNGRPAWALVDSGATRCCVSEQAARRWKLLTRNIGGNNTMKFDNSHDLILDRETTEVPVRVGTVKSSDLVSFRIVPNLLCP